VDAFLDYVEKYKTSNNARVALDEAGALALHMPDPTEQPTLGLLERFYPLAVADPFNYRAFAYNYARSLQRQNKPKEAAAEFRLVPPDDPRILDAKFFLALALHDELDDPSLSADDRRQMVSEIVNLADEVSAAAKAAAQTATDANQNQNDRVLDVKITLLGADLARRVNRDPSKTLQMLGGFEKSVAGLPGEHALLASALFLRVQSYMDEGDNQNATSQLLNYLNASNGAEGAEAVRDLLLKLNDDFDKAQAAGDVGQARKIASDRAQLSTYLVQWAEQSADPNIQKFAYRYRVYDATTHRLSADLETVPAARVAAFNDAMKRYQDLESPQNVAAYQATIPADGRIDPNYPDPQVTLGIGLVAYELGDWKEAQVRLGQLINDKKLGEGEITQTDPSTGAEKTIDNDQYWEALYKLMRADVNLAKAGDPDTKLQPVQQFLESQYILWQDKVGGTKWHEAFEQLRQEIIPDFKLGG
jgi:hypothetical protein